MTLSESIKSRKSNYVAPVCIGDNSENRTLADPKPDSQTASACAVAKFGSDSSDLSLGKSRNAVLNAHGSAPSNRAPLGGSRNARDAFPRFAAEHQSYCASRNGKASSQLVLRESARSVKADDLCDISFRQPTVPASLATDVSAATLGYSVCNIVAMGAKAKMIDIDARRNVASMKNNEAARYWPVRKTPRNPMRPHHLSAESEPTVSAPELGRDPKIARRIHARLDGPRPPGDLRFETRKYILHVCSGEF